MKKLEWTGGRNPLGDNDLVIVTYRDGIVSKPRRADTLRWEHSGLSDDVVAFELLDDSFTFRSEKPEG